MRYQRQIILKELGESGQKKLFAAKVLVIGAGGLGCPALQYLAAAGVGNIGIVDFDVVELSNLHRQILFNKNDLGKSKAKTAAEKIKSLNPDVHVEVYDVKIDQKNALQIISEYDIIIDGSDNFSTRYLVNDACVLLDKPLVYGAVLRFEGQVGVFNMEDPQTKIKCNYRDLFPEMNAEDLTFSCREAGVLGVVPGIIGNMQAAEAIKIITGIGIPLANKILSYQMLNNSFYEMELSPSNHKPNTYPKNKEEFVNFDYDLVCISDGLIEEIGLEEFETYLKDEETLIIDVREALESPRVNEFKHVHIPLSKLIESFRGKDSEETILLFCNSGQRSLRGVKILKELFPEKKIFSLKGGIILWKEKKETISK